MNPFDLIGRSFSDVEQSLEHSGVGGVLDDLEEGEEQYYSVSAVDSSWEISLGENQLIETIFIHNPDRFALHTGITSTTSNLEIEKRYGKPTSSGPQSEIELLGMYGCWERYDMKKYSIHIQHEVDSIAIKQVTIMLPEVAP